MDLIFQIPLQYCSLQNQALLLPQYTATAEYHSHFSLATSFFLDLLVTALSSSLVAYWTLSDLGSSSSDVIYFCLFILSMGFSRHKYWTQLPFPSAVDHVLSELFTMTRLSWVALHGMAFSFIELHMPLRHDEPVIHEVWQKMRWLDSITNSMDMNLGKFREMLADVGRDREDWHVAVQTQSDTT